MGRYPGPIFDLLPYLCSIAGKKCQFILAGFNGWHMTLIYISPKGIARMMSKGTRDEESKLSWFFKTTTERLGSVNEFPEENRKRN